MQGPSTDVDGQPVFNGYAHDLLLLLKEKMGFDFNYTVASNETTYDQLVECVSNGICEIVVADIAKTSTRQGKVEFSASIHDNALGLVVRKNKKKTISPFGFLKPFSPALWLSIFGIIYILSAIFIGFYEHGNGNGNGNGNDNGKIRGKSPEATLTKSLYHTIGALLQMGSELAPKSPSGRFQTVIVWLLSIVLVSLFTSNLIIYFTAKHERSWIQSIDDLKMCRKVSCNRIGVIEHSQHEEYFQKEVINKIPMNYYRLKHPRECLTKLLDGHVDITIADRFSAQYFIQQEYCQLEVAGLPFGKSDFGIVLPKEWPYKQDLDAHILELTTNGDIDQLLETYYHQNRCNVDNDDEKDNENNGLTLYETSGLFIIFACLTLLNLICYLLRVYRRTILSHIRTFIGHIWVIPHELNQPYRSGDRF